MKIKGHLGGQKMKNDVFVSVSSKSCAATTLCSK